ncbi:unnamed protein product [Lactuca saligna]|uniref:Uncharacterized protein n=1 Tax=Lactuca saligna TaxID=75948 RepID=A0AA35Z4S4_LACSI|nr:unnamed protein product [Lactuca saligna]
MANRSGIVPTIAKFETPQKSYVFSLINGVEFLAFDTMILFPLPRKVCVYRKTFTVGLRLPLTDFKDELLQKHGCSIQILTPNSLNNMVAFEMIYRANDILPDYFVFLFSSTLAPPEISTRYVPIVVVMFLSHMVKRQRISRTNGYGFIRSELVVSNVERSTSWISLPSCSHTTELLPTS